jgi:hypothetical protein
VLLYFWRVPLRVDLLDRVLTIIRANFATMATANFDPNKAQNLPEIEKQMAVKCVEQVSSALESSQGMGLTAMHFHFVSGTNAMVTLRKGSALNVETDQARR